VVRSRRSRNRRGSPVRAGFSAAKPSRADQRLER
jgi:hypothetical protein